MTERLNYLPREEVKKAIKFQNPSRVPLFIHFWIFSDNIPQFQNELETMMKENVCDFSYFMPHMPGYRISPVQNRPEYCWRFGSKPMEKRMAGLDAEQILEDWDQLDDIFRNFPDPELPELFQDMKLQWQMHNPDLYRVAHFHYLFYERLWSFRGMENALMDLCLCPEEVKRLFEKLTEFYKVIIRRCKQEMQSDALFVTDDLGTQSGLMFSPVKFRELFKPFYSEVVEECHRLGMDFWLHSCGNITQIIGDLIEIGVDVIHPIQKYAMKDEEILGKYAGKVCFWTGMDMQQVLPNGSEEEVRLETRRIIELYDQPKGGLIIGLGNGFTHDIPLRNLEAFFDEALRYGHEHRKKYQI